MLSAAEMLAKRLNRHTGDVVFITGRRTLKVPPASP
jgi:hypothetical protein